MEDPFDIAEAGLELAQSTGIEACCELLQLWAPRVTAATAASVTWEGGGRRIEVGGQLPATSEERARAGWHGFEVPSPEPTDVEWTSWLWLCVPDDEPVGRGAPLLARQAGLGFARVLRRAELARHERQQAALVEAGKALSSERSLDGVLQRIVERATEITGARYGALGVLDEDLQELTRFITVGIDAETQARIGDLPRGLGILGALIHDARPLRLARLGDDPRSVGFPEHHPPMDAFLGVPIVTSRTVAGRIYLTEKADGAEFTLEDERLVETLASQAAIAIDNASLNEQLQTVAVQLEEASRHKSAFLANMSHELRSPLNTIIGYTRLLLEDARGLDEEQLEDLAIVRGSSEHLLALITELLDLQRIEAGRVQLALADEDVSAIADTAVSSSLPSVADGVELVADLSRLHDPVACVDATRLRQVLLNVVGNAVKFTERGRIVLAVSDEEDPERLVFEVRDTGPGVPEADQRRIFDSFFQSQAALGRTPGPREGAGLGLAITRMLVELHGGTVTLESIVGAGTVVRIELPRRAGVGTGSA